MPQSKTMPPISAGSVVIKAQRSKTVFDEKWVKSHLEKAVKDTAEEANELFDDITGTWRHDVPIIEKGPTYTGDDLVMDIYTEDKIFAWLDKGTDLNMAVMGEGFVPKTSKRTYRSGVGSPGFEDPLFINKSAINDGIEPREWTDMMATDMQESLKKNLVVQFNKLVKFA